MHKLLDRLNHVSEETKDIQYGFVDSERYSLEDLKNMAQDILKKIYDTERSIVSSNFEKIGTNAITSILQIFKPDSIITHNLSKIAVQNKSRRDFRLKNMDFAHHSILKKIKNMNVQEIFEFLDTFSKKNLQGTEASRVIVAKPIRVVKVKLTPVEN